MPILRVARAHARIARAMASQRGRRNRFGLLWELLGEQSSPKWEIIIIIIKNVLI